MLQPIAFLCVFRTTSQNTKTQVRQMQFKPGQQVKVEGLTEQGKRTVEIARFIKYLETPREYEKPYGGITRLDCVIDSDGIKVMADSSKLMK